MALRLKFPPFTNIGNFDVLDEDLAGLLGGEVLGLTYVAAADDKASVDVEDGYVSYATQTRPAATRQLTSGMRPLFLCDTGTANYGSLFGQAVGGSVGQQVSGGTQFGPPIDYWSGKSALWGAEGMYSVTLDACDTNAGTGLQPTNPTLAGNAALYATSTGLLTPNALVAFEAVVLGRFMGFDVSGSKVTTPASLREAVNSGGSSTVSDPFVEAWFYWKIEA